MFPFPGLVLFLLTRAAPCVRTSCSLHGRELKDSVKLGGGPGSDEGFVALAKRTRAAALEAFTQTFASDLCVPGTPWDGKVRSFDQVCIFCP